MDRVNEQLLLLAIHERIDTPDQLVAVEDGHDEEAVHALVVWRIDFEQEAKVKD